MDLLGEMFQEYGEEEESKQAIAQGALPQYYSRRPPHCAYDMDLPPMERQESNFVGLENQ